LLLAAGVVPLAVEGVLQEAVPLLLAMVAEEVWQLLGRALEFPELPLQQLLSPELVLRRFLRFLLLAPLLPLLLLVLEQFLVRLLQLEALEFAQGVEVFVQLYLVAQQGLYQVEVLPKVVAFAPLLLVLLSPLVLLQTPLR
tara:strand:+ start:221 stop:643 length:423 start_codon:yes stop_codon:yes gene_type:complete